MAFTKRDGPTKKKDFLWKECPLPKGMVSTKNDGSNYNDCLSLKETTSCKKNGFQ